MMQPSEEVIYYLAAVHRDKPDGTSRGRRTHAIARPRRLFGCHLTDTGSSGFRETPKQRLGYFRQMIADTEPSCVAELLDTDPHLQRSNVSPVVSVTRHRPAATPVAGEGGGCLHYLTLFSIIRYI